MKLQQYHLTPILFLPLFLLTLVLISGCDNDEGRITVPQNYSEWEKTTTVELDYPIPGHMNNYRIIYINEIGENPEVLVQEDRRRITFPEGSIIVKEVYEGLDYSPGEDPSSLTVMIKKSGDPQNRGGWVWIMEDLKEGTQQVFDGEFCITCHSNANEKHPYGDGNPREEFRDFVFFLPETR